MWAQRFRDVFPRSRTAPRPDKGRVRMGHYSVPRTMAQEGWRPPPCSCALCTADGFNKTEKGQKQ